MDWGALICAGLLEIVGVIGIKRVAANNNFTNNAILVVGFLASFSMLSYAMETIALSTAYAVWTGIGTVGAAVVGIVLYKESRAPLRLFCMAGVICCIAGLKLLG